MWVKTFLYDGLEEWLSDNRMSSEHSFWWDANDVCSEVVARTFL